MAEESKSAADFHAAGVLGSLYHTVVEVAGALDVLAVAINYAEGSDSEACAEIREAWDGIMARMGRIEQLLAALPLVWERPFVARERGGEEGSNG